MNMVKKISFALLVAFAAVFTAAAGKQCKDICPDAAKIEKCSVQSIRCELAAAGYRLDESSSDDLFEWYVKGNSRKLVYVGKLNAGEEVKFVPATIYTVTIPYDGVCNPGRQLMMYHPEGYSKGILYAKNTVKLISKADNVIEAGTLLPGTVIAEFESLEMIQSAVAGGDTAGQKLGGWGQTFEDLWKRGRKTLRGRPEGTEYIRPFRL